MALPDPEDLREQARALVDPVWLILRNKVHARTAGELATSDTALVAVRSIQPADNPKPGSYDLAHLQAIYRHLFQDVYPFAGQLRTVNLRKADDPDGWFYPAARLTDRAASAFGALAGDKHLRARGRAEFVEGLARHIDTVNYLHPFREGNGRTQRIFFSQLSARAGYLSHWERISAEENIAASRTGPARWLAAARSNDRTLRRQDEDLHRERTPPCRSPSRLLPPLRTNRPRAPPMADTTQTHGTSHAPRPDCNTDPSINH